ncbi:MAG TPA: hypothetical protein VI874_05480 [Candidatus Norongarragalinales archaeon]|nr:hypothetical protein [Candidatus Norongarragalinales archaeon]
MFQKLVERFHDLGFSHVQTTGKDVDPCYRADGVAYATFPSGHVFSVSPTEWTHAVQETTRILLNQVQQSMEKKGQTLIFHSFHPVDNPLRSSHRLSGGWVVLIRGSKR